MPLFRFLRQDHRRNVVVPSAGPQVLDFLERDTLSAGHNVLVRFHQLRAQRRPINANQDAIPLDRLPGDKDGIHVRRVCLVPEGRLVFAEFTVEETIRVGAYCARARAGMAERMAQMYALFPRLHERRRARAGDGHSGQSGRFAEHDPRA